MDCRNHPGTVALATCAGCAESYCGNCLVEVRGTRYCASCKGLAVTGPSPAGGRPCAEAGEALKFAIFSFFCIGIILGPIAIKKGLAARRMIAADQTLTGEGKATAAIVMGSIALALWAISLLGRVSQSH
jgi:uncharacterized protein DUF4190